MKYFFKNNIYIYILFCLIIVILPVKSRNKLFKQYVSLSKEIPKKCWLHRTNSVEKLQELSSKYKGVEIDVFFDKEKLEFYVGHDLEKEMEISLEQMLERIDKNKKIWLDIKNLNITNYVELLKKLNELLKKYDLDKNNFILEGDKYELLSFYKKEGFYVSYYDKFELENKTKDEIEKWKRNLEMIQKYVSAISFTEKKYKYIKNFNLNIDLLTWTSSKEWEFLYLKKEKRKMLQDNQVKVILVKEYGNYHR